MKKTKELKPEFVPTPPPYMKIYKIYSNKKLSFFFDSDFILNISNLWHRGELIKSVLRELEPGQDALQIGATFGSQIKQVAEKIGYYGNYHLVDVSKPQMDRVKKKYQGIYQNMNFSNQNGLAKINFKYDRTICFMLLHELPHITRKEMVNALLSTVKEGGKVIFIDYHKPEKSGLYTRLFKKFNHLYRPFVEEFWEQEISKMSELHDQFTWHQTTMFDGFYQKVVATKK